MIYIAYIIYIADPDLFLRTDGPTNRRSDGLTKIYHEVLANLKRKKKYRVVLMIKEGCICESSFFVFFTDMTS